MHLKVAPVRKPAYIFAGEAEVSAAHLERFAAFLDHCVKQQEQAPGLRGKLIKRAA
jgi:hypothetical protein